MLATAVEAELDRGPAAAGGERFCALERAVKPVDDLIRFVVGPDDDVVPDVRRRLPGRGLWITATRAAVDEAVRRRVFARGFRKDVRVAPDLAVTTERLLERAALDALAIAAKAGCVVSGFAKVEAALGRDDLMALLHAREAADDGRRKLDAALRRNARDGLKIPVIEAFSTQQLDLALDRVNVIHAALLGGPVSATFLARTQRFLRFRDGIPAVAAGGRNTEELRTE